MGLKLQMFFVIASVLTFIFVIKKIQKHGLNIDDAIVWILWSIVLLIVSVFPSIPTWISKNLDLCRQVTLFFAYLFSFYISCCSIKQLKYQN